jgi:hypothetical protein
LSGYSRAEGRRIGIGYRNPLSRRILKLSNGRPPPRASEWVRPGMRLGLGTGSTARHVVDLLGQKVKNGLDVDGGPDLGGHPRAGRALRHQAFDA